MERQKFSLREKVIKIALPELEKIYQLSVNDPNAYLNEVQSILAKNPDLNLALYFNHISFPDPVFAFWLYLKYIDPENRRQIILPASHWHTNFLHNPAFATAFKLGKLVLGYKGIRIVQAYQLEQPETYHYTPADATNTYKNLLKAIGENPQNTTLIISPEGHRSEDGTLQKGEVGITNLVRKLTPCVLVPLGIVYGDGGFDRNGLNFGASVNLRPGQPFLWEDNRQKPTLEQIMIPLASVLPPKMQGGWRQN
jgi:1-acyl-sn-glycerol-3-phosphate acyltransferase